jgi:hypothetical protein
MLSLPALQIVVLCVCVCVCVCVCITPCARTPMFITAFTTARHQSLSWARRIHSTPPPQPVSLRSILFPSSHLRLGLSSDPFPPGFPTKNVHFSTLSHVVCVCVCVLGMSRSVSNENLQKCVNIIRSLRNYIYIVAFICRKLHFVLFILFFLLTTNWKFSHCTKVWFLTTFEYTINFMLPSRRRYTDIQNPHRCQIRSPVMSYKFIGTFINGHAKLKLVYTSDVCGMWCGLGCSPGTGRWEHNSEVLWISWTAERELVSSGGQCFM